jgi:hypothetical protein
LSEGDVRKREKLSRSHPGHLAKLVIEVGLIEIAARYSGLGQRLMLTAAQTTKDVKESGDACEFLL